MLDATLASITPLDEPAMEKCQMRLDNLTKPLNSLLYFERLVRQLAGITGNPKPSKHLKKSLLLVAGGTQDELGAKKTAQLRKAIQTGIAPINLFAQHVEAPVRLLKITPLPANGRLTKAQVLEALAQGIRAAQCEVAAGAQVLGLDALGSGSDQPAAAVIASFAAQADQDPLLVLQAYGNPVLAGLTGVLLGASAAKAAIVLDGVATNAAALLARQFSPLVVDYLIGSHISVDPAHQTSLDLLGLPGRLDLRLSSGQGVGAALGMVLVNASLHVINDMKTFGEAGVAVAQDGPGALKQSHAVRE